MARSSIGSQRTYVLECDLIPETGAASYHSIVIVNIQTGRFTRRSQWWTYLHGVGARLASPGAGELA